MVHHYKKFHLLLHHVATPGEGLGLGINQFGMLVICVILPVTIELVPRDNGRERKGGGREVGREGEILT